MLALLAEQLERASDRLAEAHYVDADTRVRRRLVELGETYRTGDGSTVVPLTQEDLAAMAGTSRATVNRVLRDEERKGAARARPRPDDGRSTPASSPSAVARHA